MQELQQDTDPEAFQQYQDQLKQNLSVFKGGLWSMGVDKLVAFLKAMVRLSLKLARNVVRVAMKLLAKTFRMFHLVLNARIQIPFLTELFEQTIMGGNARMNGYNLFALMGAVPATVSYWTQNGRPPLTEDHVQILIRSSNVNNYLNDVMEALPKTNPQMFSATLSYVIGQMYITAHGVYAAVSMYNNLTPLPMRLIQGYFMSFSQYVMQITAVPFNWELDRKSASYAFRQYTWHMALASFFLRQGNPTIVGLVSDGFITAVYQTMMAVPRMIALIASLMVDLAHATSAEYASASMLRFLGYMSSTVSQFMEYFAMPPTHGFSTNNAYDPREWALDIATYASYVAFPAKFIQDFSVMTAQSVLEWSALSFHTIRLYSAMLYAQPFLN
jgi:hypothetical protein